MSAHADHAGVKPRRRTGTPRREIRPSSRPPIEQGGLAVERVAPVMPVAVSYSARSQEPMTGTIGDELASSMARTACARRMARIPLAIEVSPVPSNPSASVVPGERCTP